jgi:hypothetical protein
MQESVLALCAVALFSQCAAAEKITQTSIDQGALRGVKGGSDLMKSYLQSDDAPKTVFEGTLPF